MRAHKGSLAHWYETPPPPQPPRQTDLFDGLVHLGVISPNYKPSGLPRGALLVSPAGLVARLIEHSVETEAKKDSSKKVHRRKVVLVELGRWMNGELVSTTTGYEWAEYSDGSQYNGRGPLSGWSVWGVP